MKFRNRIGTEGMKQIEVVLFEAWSDMGLVKTRWVATDTTAQPQNIAYPADTDLLYRIREKIVRSVKRVREEITPCKPFRTHVRPGEKLFLGIKRFHQKNPENRKEAIKEPKETTHHVGEQAAGVANSLYTVAASRSMGGNSTVWSLLERK